MDHHQQQQADESSPVGSQPLSQRNLTLEDPLPPASASGTAPPTDSLTARSDASTPTASNINQVTADSSVDNRKDEKSEETGRISQKGANKKQPFTRRNSAGSSGRTSRHGRRHSSGHVHNDAFSGNNAFSGNIHHHRHSHNEGHRSIQSSLDLPLPIASLVEGTWQSRKTVHRTPRRIATLKLPTRSSSSSSSEIDGDGSIDGDASATVLCIAGHEYIVVANTVANGLGIYRLSSQEQPQQSTISGSAASTPVKPTLPDLTELVAPWSTVALASSDNDDDAGEDDHEGDEMGADTKDSAAIVSLTALPWGQSLIYGESCRDEELHIVAVTDDGQVFIVRLRQGDAAGTVKLFEFSTMNFGVTCACVLPVHGPTVDLMTGSPRTNIIGNNSTPLHDLTLLVGYQAGYVENWKIFRFSSDRVLSKMLWRGMYPSNYTIHNMTPLNYTPSSTNTMTAAKSDKESVHHSTEEDGGNLLHSPPSKPSKRPSIKEDGIQLLSPSTKRPSFKANRSPKSPARKSNEIKDHPLYLLLTLFSPTDTLKTGSMVEVIDIGSLMSIWKGNDSTQEGLGRLRAINLSSPQRWIMPANGMEILPSSTIASASSSSRNCDGCLPQRAHLIPSTATGSICKCARTNIKV